MVKAHLYLNPEQMKSLGDSKRQLLYFKNVVIINYIWQLLRVFHYITSDQFN